jgi:hypothetical protein
MDSLRDPVWTFVGVVVAILIAAVIVSVTLWLRNRKALSYEVVSDVPLVTISHGANDSATEAIEIRYNGNPVQDVRLVVVRLWNSGNVPIAQNDYDEPLTLQFGGQLLASDVIESTPPALKKKAIAGGGIGPGYAAIAFHNLVLNPRDSITVQALLTDFTGDVSVEGHIVGIPSIRRSDDGQVTGWALAFSFVLGLCGIIGFVVALNARDSVASLAASLVVGVALGMAIGALTYQRLLDVLRRRLL